MTDHQIIILTRTPMKPAWRFAIAPACQIAVIGVGVMADSAAMQWAGFWGLLFIVAIIILEGVTATIENDKRMTVDEARARLDEIERTARKDRPHD